MEMCLFFFLIPALQDIQEVTWNDFMTANTNIKI